jgi:hypothetical protein
VEGLRSLVDVVVAISGVASQKKGLCRSIAIGTYGVLVIERKGNSEGSCGKDELGAERMS